MRDFPRLILLGYPTVILGIRLSPVFAAEPIQFPMTACEPVLSDGPIGLLMLAELFDGGLFSWELPPLGHATHAEKQSTDAEAYHRNEGPRPHNMTDGPWLQIVEQMPVVISL